jgi:hypothetical protein
LSLRRNLKQLGQILLVATRFTVYGLRRNRAKMTPGVRVIDVPHGCRTSPLYHEAKRLKLSAHEARLTLGLKFLSVNLHPKLEDPLRFAHYDTTMP